MATGVCSAPIPVVHITLPSGARRLSELGARGAPDPGETARAPTRAWERTLVFAAGTGALVFVPIFKTLTDLPPFLGILLALGVLWAVTELVLTAAGTSG